MKFLKNVVFVTAILLWLVGVSFAIAGGFAVPNDKPLWYLVWIAWAIVFAAFNMTYECKFSDFCDWVKK